MIKLYNTLNNREEELKVVDNRISIYLCGPTVYSYIHVGNVRPLVFFDTVRRFLSLKYEVTFIQNFTDIDDKIIKGAKEEGTTIKELSNKYIDEYYLDVNKLNVLKPNIIPKATEYIENMILEIEKMLKESFAYKKDDGIYFDVSKFENYGELSNRDSFSVEDDFALWKFSNESDSSWEASFGRGRPGWHLECSTMILSTVGRVDIHAGGQDLMFPHHENEKAQYESLYKGYLAKYWMHNSFINFNSEKMSKSKGNIIRARDLLSEFSGNIVRFFILSTHYRKPISMKEDSFVEAKKAFDILENFLKTDYILKGDKEVENNLLDSFEEHMSSDFNTQGVFGEIFKEIKSFNKSYEEFSYESYSKFKEDIAYILKTMGFEIEINSGDEKIKELIKEREDRRSKREFAEADNIRDKLSSMGVEMFDGKAISWRYK